MSTITEELQIRAKELSSLERVILVEKILESLDAVDPNLEMLWAAEAEDRLDAWKRGEIKTAPITSVLPEL